MGTKNLARTVIEGGRSHYNQYRRNHSHGQERAAAARFFAGILGGDDPDDAVVEPRPRVRKQFSDKLGAAERWLRSQRGEQWDSIHSEIRRRFDTRTVAGQHIVFDHLLPRERAGRSVDRFGPRRPRFFVDDEGRLQEKAYRRKRTKYRTHFAAVDAFAKGCRIIQRGDHLYWAERIGDEWEVWIECEDRPCRWSWRCGYRHVRDRIVRAHPVIAGRYRQGRALTRAERRTWESFDDLGREWVRARFLCEFTLP
jgi:hypothetical protein